MEQNKLRDELKKQREELRQKISAYNAQLSQAQQVANNLTQELFRLAGGLEQVENLLKIIGESNNGSPQETNSEMQ